MSEAVTVWVVLSHSGHGESSRIADVYATRTAAEAWLRAAGCRPDEDSRSTFMSRDGHTYYHLTEHIVYDVEGFWSPGT